MLRTLAQRDLLTPRIVEVALRLADPKWLADLPADDAETRRERQAQTREYIDALIATFIREQRAPDSDAWEPLDVDPADIATGAIDEADLDALEDLVLRLRTADEITAASLDVPLDQDAEVGAEALREFRRDGRSAPDGADSGALVDPPEPLYGSA
jgi:hypothetical protein